MMDSGLLEQAVGNRNWNSRGASLCPQRRRSGDISSSPQVDRIAFQVGITEVTQPRTSLQPYLLSTGVGANETSSTLKTRKLFAGSPSLLIEP
jgi:hypothetical protein